MGGAARAHRRGAGVRRDRRPALFRSGQPIRRRGSTAFATLARDLDSEARADNAAYVLTQGYALTSLMSYYGDPAIAIVQPEQRMRWIFEPAPPETLFAAPGLALGEPGRRFDLILRMRFRNVEPAGLIERRARRRSRSKPTSSTGSPTRTRPCSIPSAQRGGRSSANAGLSDAADPVAPVSSEPQRDNADEDDQRSDGALRLERLAEQDDADQRGEHDRGFAQGGDRRDWRAGSSPRSPSA